MTKQNCCVLQVACGTGLPNKICGRRNSAGNWYYSRRIKTSCLRKASVSSEALQTRLSIPSKAWYT